MRHKKRDPARFIESAINAVLTETGRFFVTFWRFLFSFAAFDRVRLRAQKRAYRNTRPLTFLAIAAIIYPLGITWLRQGSANPILRSELFNRISDLSGYIGDAILKLDFKPLLAVIFPLAIFIYLFVTIERRIAEAMKIYQQVTTSAILRAPCYLFGAFFIINLIFSVIAVDANVTRGTPGVTWLSHCLTWTLYILYPLSLLWIIVKSLYVTHAVFVASWPKSIGLASTTSLLSLIIVAGSLMIIWPILARPVVPIQGGIGRSILEIDVRPDRVSIGGRPLERPLTVESLKARLGQADRISKYHATEYTWDSLGIIAYERPYSGVINSIMVTWRSRPWAFWPTHPFTGELTVGGSRLTSDVDIEKVNTSLKDNAFTEIGHEWVWKGPAASVSVFEAGTPVGAYGAQVDLFDVH